VEQYQHLLQKILTSGEDRPDRTGVGTISLFGEQLKFDLRQGFPLQTTKKMFWKGIVHELLWFLHPTTNLDYLHEHNVRIWDEWASPIGYVGPIYGNNWRRWRDLSSVDEYQYIDQLGKVIEQIKTDLYSRRHFVSAWNVVDLNEMALEPCHVSFQFYVSQARGLSCHMYQRSADMFLGVPWNIASYALLTHMVAHVTGHPVDQLIISFGDVHIYQNHLDQVKEVLSRTPYPLPTLALSPSIRDIDHFKFEDLSLSGYQSHPSISAPIAV
jgi:thymidylate synthase